MDESEPQEQCCEGEQPDLKTACQNLRSTLQFHEDAIRGLKHDPQLNGYIDGEIRKSADEAKAQVMLAVRHLEDARMRLGKVIQYGCDNGVNIIDGSKPTL